VDQGDGAGGKVDVGTLNDDLVLGHLRLAAAGVVTEHIDGTNDLLTQKVTDFNTLTTVDNGDVDGEMGVDHAHAVTELLGGTGDHVLDVGADGTEAGDLLGETIIQGDLDLLAVIDLVDGDGQVTEVTLQGGAIGGLDGNTARSDGHFDTLRHNNGLLGTDNLHFQLTVDIYL